MSPIFDPDEHEAAKEAKRDLSKHGDPCPLGCPGDPLIGCDHCYSPDGEPCRCRACGPPRVLLVGEANPWGGDPSFALYPEPRGASGDRLCRLVMGLRGGQYLRAFDRVNLCPHRWSVKVARVRAAEILETAPTRKAIVLLGVKVRDAFGLKGNAPCVVPAGTVPEKRMASIGCAVVLLPHPSGLCRFWGEPDAVKRAQAVLIAACVLPVAPAERGEILQ